MTAAITGAAIGLVVWATAYVAALIFAGHRDGPNIHEVFTYALVGAAIGWLIGGAA